MTIIIIINIGPPKFSKIFLQAMKISNKLQSEVRELH